ncbi:MAG: insulinase family protein [Prevotellaceae bacterium]|jgi:predicted Zn-dependent peptidase|nr:insulinase family protein [Prevotellaceae bacterium]
MLKKFITLFIVPVMVAGMTANGQTADGIKFTEYDLPNGLHVILHKDDHTPNAVVSLMYHVGAKNEDTARTGFAHLFEHLLFEGSKYIDRGDYMKIVQANGGSLNANTTQDRTYYYELMPSNQLELALWMESERMLHAKIDTIGVNTQKGVVIEEKKQSYDNRPYGSWMYELGRRAYTVHPYRWQTIGSEEHIRNSTFDDVYNFYKTFYVPNNAALVVVGDIDEEQTKKWIAKYFGDIPRGSLPIYRPTVTEPEQKAEIRDTIYDNIQLPAIFMGYHGPAMTEDAYAVDILASILSSGASSRFKTNITDKGLSLQTMMFPHIQEHPGLIYVIGVGNMGKDIVSVDSALNAEIDRIRTEPVSEEEFQMAMAAKEFAVAAGKTNLENIASGLAENYTYLRDAGRINRVLSHYQKVTREDVLRVAKKYLAPSNRVTLCYLPKSAQTKEQE